MIASLLLAAALSQASYYSPDEAKALFEQGNAAYERADYKGAIASWQKLVEHGLDGQDVLYNLGTAALQDGDLGHAVLWLERARRSGGPREDLDANLESARRRQGDEVVGGLNGEPFIERIAAASPTNLVCATFLIAWLGGFAFAFLFRWLRPGNRAVVGVLAGLLLTASVPLAFLVGAHIYVAEALQDGVVLSSTMQAREQPSPQSKVSFEVHAGLKVRLLESEGAFVRIRLPNGRVGWAEKEGIAEL